MTAAAPGYRVPESGPGGRAARSSRRGAVPAGEVPAGEVPEGEVTVGADGVAADVVMPTTIPANVAILWPRSAAE